MGFIQEAFDTNWVVPLGPTVNAFEQALECFVGQDKKVVALSAGTAAVHPVSYTHLIWIDMSVKFAVYITYCLLYLILGKRYFQIISMLKMCIRDSSS